MTAYFPIRPLCLLQLALACLAITIVSRTNAQAPPQEINVPLMGNGQQATLQMRYIPAGKLDKDPPRRRPAAETADANSIDALGLSDVAPFYMSTTELTFGQLRAIMPASALQRIRERIQRTSGQDQSNQYLRAAIDSTDYPAFAISLGEAAEACQRLTEIVNARPVAANATASIETLEFRLPSHLEWQYACRAVGDPQQTASLPHFNRWVELDALDRVTRAMINEELQKAGRDANSFAGTQFDVLELIDSRLGASDALGAPEKILTAYFKQALGVTRDCSKQYSRLTAVAKGQPNAWGLFDMHDNVCEWVLVASSRDEFNKLWESLSNPASSARDTKCLVLAGGGFSHDISKAGAWRSFSAWGGHPADPATGIPAPLAMTDGLDDTERGVAADMNAGVRLVLDRKLRSDWFAVVRRTALKHDPTNALDAFPRFRGTAAEVATSQEAPRIAAMLDLYAALAAYRQTPGDEQTAALSSSLVAAAKMKPAGAKASRIGQLLASKEGTGAKPTAQSPPEDDELFFSAASRVFAASPGRN